MLKMTLSLAACMLMAASGYANEQENKLFNVGDLDSATELLNLVSDDSSIELLNLINDSSSEFALTSEELEDSSSSKEALAKADDSGSDNLLSCEEVIISPVEDDEAVLARCSRCPNNRPRDKDKA